MKQKKDLSTEKQIERIEKQILKFGDSKSNPTDKYGTKRQIINNLKEGLNHD
jgi:hypothetical protein